MAPTITQGMWLSVEPAHTPPCPGDIILITCNQRYVAHRVLLNPDPGRIPFLITKGDGCRFADPPVYRDRVIGTVSVQNSVRSESSARQFIIRQLQLELSAVSDPAGSRNSLPENPVDRSYFYEELLAVSQLEGLEAFTCNRLENMGLSAQLPEAIALRAEKRFSLHLLSTACMMDEYHQVAGEFSRAGISFVPVKGIALAQTVYAHLKDRSFNDMDILVRPDQISLAGEILKKKGYHQDSNRTRLGAQAARVINHHLPPFRKNRIIIELHYRLLPSDPGGFSESFLQHSVPDKESTYRPDRFYHAVFLAAHLDKHAGRGEFQYRLIRDLALLLGTNAESWAEALQLAGKFGLDESFKRAKTCFEILYIEGQHPETGKIFTARHSHPIDHITDNLVLLKGAKLKLIWLFDLLFPSPDYIRKTHPGCTGIRLTDYYIRRMIKGFRLLLFR